MNRLRVFVILGALAASACSVSPVITDPGDNGGDRYGGCRRAARDVCKYRESGDDARKQCVAEATYDCVKGGGE
jgi:hypothetical protein